MISFHFYALEGPSIFCHFCQAYYFKCFLFPFSFVEKSLFKEFCGETRPRPPSAGQPLLDCQKQKTSQSPLSLSILFYLITESTKARKVSGYGYILRSKCFPLTRFLNLFACKLQLLKLIINGKPQFI